MKPIDHPLAIAYLEARAAYLRDGEHHYAKNAVALSAWRDAGYPLYADLPADPAPNTVRVRVAVSVSPDGAWSAAGGCGVVSAPLPCPFCGGEPLVCAGSPDFLECGACGTMGPDRKPGADAMTVWNRRANPALRAAFESGYRMGYRNGYVDAEEGDDRNEEPGEAFDLWTVEGEG